MKAFLFHFSLLELQKPTLAGPCDDDDDKEQGDSDDGGGDDGGWGGGEFTERGLETGQYMCSAVWFSVIWSWSVW